MKKLQIFITAFLLLFLLPCGLSAQSTRTDSLRIDPKHRELLHQARACLFGINGQEVNYEKAVAIYRSLAEEEVAHAFYMLGNLYLAGTGLEQSDSLAMQHFLAAVKRGYGKAALSIAAMKMTDENWTTYEDWQEKASEAAYWLAKSAECGSPDGYYALGYAYYQGLGVAQDYQKAIEYFEAATAAGHLKSSYMLGFCYLNGYGAERNAGKGAALIRSAADKGHRHSADFLTTVRNTDNFTQAMVDMDGDFKQPVQFSDILNHKTPRQFTPMPNNVQKHKIRSDNSCADTVRTISGDWSGKLITYDWSGQSIIDEQEIALSIYEIAGTLYGAWSDNNNSIDIQAALKDTVWVFDNNTILYGKQPVSLKFATFNYSCNEGGELLTGNLWRYVLYTKSFMQPAVMVLSKNTVPPSITIEEKDGGKDTIEKEELLDSQSIVIYPNPVSDMLTVKYSLNKPVELTIAIYSSMGKAVYSKTGKYAQGDHTESLWLAGLPGMYSLRISGEGVNYITQIIKN
ncbi:MAG: T9SS type A sorting domain-containing protein [Bacteroidales bacterium]|nr:T9SS type A sorting domain-containing protein [Bacteroidales bacterium]